MRVLWLVNRVLPMFYKELGLKETNFGGGWLTGLINSLKSNESVKMGVCAPMAEITDIKKGTVDGVDYFFYPERDVRLYLKESVPFLKRVTDEFQPDVIHIFGTEYPRTLEMIEAAGSEKVLISLTGILCEYVPRFRAGLPGSMFPSHTVVRKLAEKVPRLRFMSNRLLSYQEDDYKKRSVYEVEAIRRARYVSGRTGFDRKFSEKVNPDIRYLFCNESLRDSFYTLPKWNYAKCRKHSIFISNAGYPLKGFHKVVEACGSLLEHYPNLMVFVAGNSPFSDHPNLKQKLIEWTDEYGMYLKKLIKQNGMQDHIRFLGSLSERRMAEQYQKCNVFILPSSAENSPNSLGEAMLLGTPCIASRVGGVEDMLISGKEGLTYDFPDTEVLSNSIVQIFDYPEQAAEYGRNAVLHAEKTHNRDVNAKTMLENYRTIIADEEK